MKYKKCIIMLVLAVFIFGAASVCASDVNDTVIAGEDDSPVELSLEDSDEMISSGEDEQIGQTGNDELISEGNSGTFAELQAYINAAGSTLTLNKSYQCEDGFDSEGILIGKSITIDGQGNKIDAQEKSRIFRITADNVVLKNIIFTNGKTTGKGGAVHFSSNGAVMNCNFTKNTADDGGAVYYVEGSAGETINCNFTDNIATSSGGALVFLGNGAVTGCNFINNAAQSGSGGAIYFSNGTVSDCNFTSNKAVYGGAVYFNINGTATDCCFDSNQATGYFAYGGAVYFEKRSSGEAVNCKFADNRAKRGGAIYFDQGSSGKTENCIFAGNSATDSGAIYTNGALNVIADACIFKSGSDSTNGVSFIPPTLTVDNFTTEFNSHEKLMFDLKTSGGRSIEDGIISISVYHNNNSWVGNYSCLSGEGWAVDLLPGSYYAIFNTEYAGFEPVRRTITVISHYVKITAVSTTNMTVNITAKSDINPEVIQGNMIFILSDGNEINANYAGNGTWWAMHTFNDYGDYQVDASYDGVDNLIVESAIIEIVKNRFSELQALISANYGSILKLDEDYEFENDFDINGINITDSITIDGQGHTLDAKGKGRIFNVAAENVILKNIIFTNGYTTGNGGAVFFKSNDDGTVSNPYNTGSFDIISYCSVTNCTFTGNKADNGGAVWMNSGSVENCNFTGNNATMGSAIYFSSSSATKTVSNSIFLNNRANAESLDVVKNDNDITIIFKGQNNLLNAIYSNGDVTFNNVTYWGKNGITTISDTIFGSNKAAGQNITVKGLVNGNIIDETRVTDENGEIVLDSSGDYLIIVSHKGDSYYTEVAETLFTNMNLYVNVTSVTTANKTVNITAKSNICREVLSGKLLFILPNGAEINADYAGNGTWWALHTFDDYAVYQVTASYVGLDSVSVNRGTITVTAPEHTFSFLNYKINGNDNSVIELSNDFYFDYNYDRDFVNGIVISRSVVIQGNGHVINADEIRIFKITNDAQVVIRNVTLVNGEHEEGGAIYNDGSNLTIIDSTIADNFAYDGGGAVYVNDGILTVITSTLTGNGVYDYGGAIYINGGSLEIFNSTLSSNYAEEGGGAIYSNGYSLTIINSTLDNNRAGNYGGAVYNGQGDLTVIGSRIGNNYAEDDVAVCTGNSDNVVFKNNEIINGYIEGFTADDSNRFIIPPRFGLMPVFDSSLRIRVFEKDGRRFTGDVTLTVGGEDYVVHLINGTGKTDVINSIMASGDYYANITFNGNDEYPAVDYENVGFSLSINTFSNLYALFIESIIDHGEVILNRNYTLDYDDEFDFIDEYFDLLAENALTIDGRGYTINCYGEGNFLNVGPGERVTVKNLIIMNGMEDRGAAIYNKGNLTVINSTFINNYAYEDGGAIYSSHGHVTIIGSIFSLNVADYGGAILIDNSYLTIIDSTFTGNRAEDGGAIYNFAGTSVMDNVTFINNYAESGGAIFVIGSGEIMGAANPSTDTFLLAAQTGNEVILKVANSIFDNNTAEENAGAIYIGNAAATINNSLFNKNSANMGGSIYNMGVLTIFDSNLTNNFAFEDFESHGGAILSSGNLIMNHTVLSNNSAYGDNSGVGGAIFISEGHFEITESTFINNYAYYGGAIFVNKDTTILESPGPANDVLSSAQENSVLGEVVANDILLRVTDSTFMDNRAYKGGAIYNEGIAIVTGSRFDDNMANAGGAIYNTRLLTISKSAFGNNLANKSSNAYGGAIYNDEDGNVNITACELSYNSVKGKLAFGGAIYNVGEAYVKDSTLTFNRAIGTDFATAGAIYNQNKLFVINSTFANNTATAISAAEGGAILTAVGQLIVDDSTFSCNVASANQSAGGAIINLYGNATINDSTFKNNSANNGSAVMSGNREGMPPSNINVENSKFIDDSVEGFVLDDSNMLLSEPVFEIHVSDGVSGGPAEITVNEIKMGGEFNGTVTVRIGNADYPVKVIRGHGNATIDLVIGFGTYNATLYYPGDLNYSAVTVQSNSFVVSPAEVEMVIPPLDGLSGNGEFTIAISNDAEGNVTLTINGKDYVFGVSGGKANVKLPELADGNYDYVIAYSGDGKYSSFTSSGSLTVKNPSKPVNPVKPTVPTKPVKTTLTLKKVKVKRSAKKLVIQATLKVNGKAVKGKIIKFKFNKKSYKARTNAKGVAKITVKKSVLKKLKKGKKVTYTATYGKITKKVKVTVKK